MVQIAELTAGNILLLAILATVVIIGARVLMLLGRGVRLWDIDFEVNPFSIASQAARSEQDGRIGEALRLYAKAGQGRRVVGRLQASLPNWPVRNLLIAAITELVDLEERAITTRAAIIPDAVKGRLGDYIESAANVVWTSADRIAAASRLTTGMPKGLQRETDKLERLLQAIRDARNSLAELALSPDSSELGNVERDFRRLSETAETLASEGINGDEAS